MFKLKIEMGNAAMLNRRDVARALKEVAAKLNARNGTEGRIMDENGNTVGSWEFTGKTDWDRDGD